MDTIAIQILKFILEIIVFLVLMVVFEFLLEKIKHSSHKLFNIKEYFPDEEIHSLNQISYLIMMGFFFIIILYTVIHDSLPLVIFDILISLYLAANLDKSSLKNKILLILLVPYGALTYIIFGNSLMGIMDIIHVPVFFYFIKVYYDKFREYTESNGLGITILLLFSIIFISFFLTQITESKNPLDALVMVSNAFTSNGYAVLGSSNFGKINSIILVWSGYLLSSVGTATLTAAILMNHFRGKLEEIEEATNRRFDKLEELIKNDDT